MTTFNAHQIESYQDRFGRHVTARLSDSTQSLPNDITERLKAARMQALAKRKVVKLQTATSVNTHGGAASLTMGDAWGGFWNRLGSVMPLVLLVIGLLSIAFIQEQRVAKEIADVDVELLADELPPSAYTDPGFVHFLNANRRD
ncbi:MAG: DUF3619 family protein [Burkholderiales bacterium]|nr:DUF3619 family protein [Burkholderiales bacterium]